MTSKPTATLALSVRPQSCNAFSGSHRQQLTSFTPETCQLRKLLCRKHSSHSTQCLCVAHCRVVSGLSLPLWVSTLHRRRRPARASRATTTSESTNGSQKAEAGANSRVSCGHCSEQSCAHSDAGCQLADSDVADDFDLAACGISACGDRR